MVDAHESVDCKKGRKDIADGLDRLGFDTSPGTGDAENSDFDASVVRYAGDDEAEARFVAAQLQGDVEVEEVDSVEGADVEVVTGSSFEGIESDLQPPPEPLGEGGGAGGGTPPVGQVPSVDPPENRECG